MVIIDSIFMFIWLNLLKYVYVLEFYGKRESE